LYAGETSRDIVFGVKDAVGNPASGKTVNFTMQDVYGNSTSTVVLAPQTAITNASGQVITRLTSDAASIYKIVAKLADNDASAATFLKTSPTNTSGGGSTSTTTVSVSIQTGSVVNNANVTNAVVNQGTIVNATIQSSATVTGGTLAGIIQNAGVLIDIRFTGEFLSGGTLSGNVKNTNGGTVKNVKLDADTKVDGGKVSGNVEGKKEKPAKLTNVKVESNTTLSNVILDNTVELPKDKTVTLVNVSFVSVTIVTNIILQGSVTGDAVKPTVLDEGVEIGDDTAVSNVVITKKVKFTTKIKFVSNVTFSDLSLIPTNTNIMGALPTVSCNICKDVFKEIPQVDLNNPFVSAGKTVLESLKSMTAFSSTTIKLAQNTVYKYTQVTVQNVRFAIQPKRVTIDPTAVKGEVKVKNPTTVSMTTNDGITVEGEPVPQKPDELQKHMAGFGLPNVVVKVEGNIRIAISESTTEHFSAHPDLATTEVGGSGTKDEYGNPRTAGVFFTQSTFIKTETIAYQNFVDEDGKLRRQIFAPAPANPSLMQEAASKFGVEVDNLWQMNMKIDGKKHRGVLGYHVKKVAPPADGQFKIEFVKQEGNKTVYALTDSEGNQQDLTTQPTGE
jgi:hypothetical protein